MASVLGDAAAAFGCVNRVEKLIKQFLRGAVAQLLARPPVQFISRSQDILRRERLNGRSLRNEGSKQPMLSEDFIAMMMLIKSGKRNLK